MSSQKAWAVVAGVGPGTQVYNQLLTRLVADSHAVEHQLLDALLSPTPWPYLLVNQPTMSPL